MRRRDSQEYTRMRWAIVLIVRVHPVMILIASTYLRFWAGITESLRCAPEATCFSVTQVFIIVKKFSTFFEMTMRLVSL
jgi:hypothetical protein